MDKEVFPKEGYGRKCLIMWDSSLGDQGRILKRAELNQVCSVTSYSFPFSNQISLSTSPSGKWLKGIERTSAILLREDLSLYKPRMRKIDSLWTLILNPLMRRQLTFNWHLYGLFWLFHIGISFLLFILIFILILIFLVHNGGLLYKDILYSSGNIAIIL